MWPNIILNNWTDYEYSFILQWLMYFTRLIFCVSFIYLQFNIHKYVFELPQCTHGTISNKCSSVREMFISRVCLYGSWNPRNRWITYSGLSRVFREDYTKREITKKVDIFRSKCLKCQRSSYFPVSRVCMIIQLCKQLVGLPL